MKLSVVWTGDINAAMEDQLALLRPELTELQPTIGASEERVVLSQIEGTVRCDFESPRFHFPRVFDPGFDFYVSGHRLDSISPLGCEQPVRPSGASLISNKRARGFFHGSCKDRQGRQSRGILCVHCVFAASMRGVGTERFGMCRGSGTFFRWVKQNLKIKTFLGTSRNAVLAQIWVAMIYFLLLAYFRFLNRSRFSLTTLTQRIADTLMHRVNLLEVVALTRIPPPPDRPSPQLSLFER